MNDVNNYIRLNNSFDKSVIFRLGISGGFFSEYNNMLVCMLYCMQHKIRFRLDSMHANFAVKNGWTDFFEPFCEEVINDENIHQKTVDWRYLIKSIFKNQKISLFDNLRPYIYFWNKSLLTQDIYGKARSSASQKRFYDFPELNIHGDFRDACGAFLNMTWHYNEAVKSEIEKIIQELNLPLVYLSMHIRGGDKAFEYQLFSIDTYFKKLEKSTSLVCNNIFLLTDDYNIYKKCKIKYPNYNFWTLCEEKDSGYNNSLFVKQDPIEKRRKLVRLFAAMDIMTSSLCFIGTYTANPGLFLGMRIPKKTICVDSDKWKIW